MFELDRTLQKKEKLDDNVILEQIIKSDGTEYSLIIIGGVEMLSCDRESEGEMIDYYFKNKEHYQQMTLICTNDKHLEIIEKATQKTKNAPSSIEKYIYVFDNGKTLESVPLTSDGEKIAIKNAEANFIKDIIPVDYYLVK